MSGHVVRSGAELLQALAGGKPQHYQEGSACSPHDTEEPQVTHGSTRRKIVEYPSARLFHQLRESAPD